MTDPRSVVVVGASLAGLSAVRGLRAEGFTGPITVIGAEVHLPYDRPPLSKEFLSADDVDIALVDGVDETLDAQWLLGRAAAGLATGADGSISIRIADGSTVSADVVVIATGARARTLPGCGDLTGVHTLRTVDDALALRDSFTRTRRLTVIGAGFIGAEIAGTANALGLEVTIVEAASAPLAAALGPQIAGVCASLHARNGVRLLAGVGVGALTGDGRVDSVVLDEGTHVPADTVLIGIGSVPNTEWAAHPALLTDRGFVTDSSCRTTIPGVYAIGDCARVYDENLRTHHRSEHWTNATTQARVVAAAIMGRTPPRRTAPYFWSCQYGRMLQFAGYFTPTDSLRVIDGALDSPSFTAVYEREGEPVAVFAMDSPRLFTRCRKQIEAALNSVDATTAS
ncbi:MAG: hypothetical protein QOD97_1541 [Mycobacterium sp.]|nr:hypothetical protein [Mycobacterium sp.]